MASAVAESNPPLSRTTARLCSADVVSTCRLSKRTSMYDIRPRAPIQQSGARDAAYVRAHRPSGAAGVRFFSACALTLAELRARM
jgi:hypothetical protein